MVQETGGYFEGHEALPRAFDDLRHSPCLIRKRGGIVIDRHDHGPPRALVMDDGGIDLPKTFVRRVETGVRAHLRQVLVTYLCCKKSIVLLGCIVTDRHAIARPLTKCRLLTVESMSTHI